MNNRPLSPDEFNRMVEVALLLDRLDQIDEITNLGGCTEDADLVYEQLITKVRKP